MANPLNASENRQRRRQRRSHFQVTKRDRREIKKKKGEPKMADIVGKEEDLELRGKRKRSGRVQAQGNIEGKNPIKGKSYN